MNNIKVRSSYLNIKISKRPTREHIYIQCFCAKLDNKYSYGEFSFGLTVLELKNTFFIYVCTTAITLL